MITSERFRIGLIGAAVAGSRSGTATALENLGLNLKRIGTDVVRIVTDPTADPTGAAGRIRQGWEALAAFRPHAVLAETLDVTVCGILEQVLAARIPVALVHHEYHRYAPNAVMAEQVRNQVVMWHRRCALSVVENADQEAMLSAAGIPSVVRLSRGVDLTLFHPARRDPTLRAQWGAGADEVVLVHVGRLVPQKAPDLLIAACRAARVARPTVRAVIVGAGPTREQLERELPWAVFTGQLQGEALAAAYASGDLFLHPSPREGFMITASEAMASGVPVVLVDQPAVREMPPGWLCGVAAPVGDDAAFCTAVADLVQDGARRRTWAAQCPAAVAGLSWPLVAKQWADALAGMVAGQHGR
jgi:glycosyltransferase involved in cell wall biosynthesis